MFGAPMFRSCKLAFESLSQQEECCTSLMNECELLMATQGHTMSDIIVKEHLTTCQDVLCISPLQAELTSVQPRWD